MHRTRVGIISDTHGLLRSEALAFLQGCDRIIHAGDVGGPDILQQLSAIAPVTAVRGNNDKGGWAKALAETEIVEIGSARVYVIHELALMDIEPESACVQVIVSGHSHRPSMQRRNDVIYLNPGSAGPRRFRLPVAVAELIIANGAVDARTVELDVITSSDRNKKRKP